MRKTVLRRVFWPSGLLLLGILLGVFRLQIGDRLGVPVTAAAALLSHVGLAWLGSRIFGLALDFSPSRKRPYPKLFKDLIAVLFFFAALVATAASLLEQKLVGALAGSSLVLAVLGFAVRNVVADTLSGIALGVEGPYRIGDWVDIDQAARGRVVDIGWRTTRLLTLDSTYVILPNSQIARRRITNYSAPRPQYRAQISLRLSQDVPVDTARQLILGALASASLIKNDPPPDVKVVELGTDAISYAVRFWLARVEADADARDEVLSLINRRLREAAVPAPALRLDLSGSSGDFGGRLSPAQDPARVFAQRQAPGPSTPEERPMPPSAAAPGFPSPQPASASG